MLKSTENYCSDICDRLAAMHQDLNDLVQVSRSILMQQLPKIGACDDTIIDGKIEDEYDDSGTKSLADRVSKIEILVESIGDELDELHQAKSSKLLSEMCDDIATLKSELRAIHEKQDFDVSRIGNLEDAFREFLTALNNSMTR